MHEGWQRQHICLVPCAALHLLIAMRAIWHTVLYDKAVLTGHTNGIAMNGKVGLAPSPPTPNAVVLRHACRNQHTTPGYRTSNDAVRALAMQHGAYLHASPSI